MNGFEMRCPECGDDSKIDVAVQTFVRLLENGVDQDLATNEDGVEWTYESACICRACGHAGMVMDFDVETSDELQIDDQSVHDAELDATMMCNDRPENFLPDSPAD